MPSGVALQAMEGTTSKGSTSYEQFMQAGVGGGAMLHHAKKETGRKQDNKTALAARPPMPDWKCTCGTTNYHYKHAPTYRNEAARLLTVTKCSKCQKARPGVA